MQVSLKDNLVETEMILDTLHSQINVAVRELGQMYGLSKDNAEDVLIKVKTLLADELNIK